jgi:hypothetical protein
LFRQDWVIYAKPTFGGPEYVLQYLARYTHRVTGANENIKVTLFRTRQKLLKAARMLRFNSGHAAHRRASENQRPQV